MHVVARVRHVLARHPSLYWAGVAVLAVGAGGAVAVTAASVDAARQAWGEPRSVLVATVDLAPGDPIPGAATRRDLPAPMLPADALEALPADAVARQHIGAGEVLVAADVAAPRAPQALIPDGWSAVAVAETVPTGAVTGDAVRAVAEGIVLADAGIVVGRSGDALLVAVPDDAAPAVATAATAGTLALLLVP